MADSIDGVIAQMDQRLDRAVTTDDPRGYFAAVYRAVTARVRDGIEQGEFADCDRMERFDVRFAQLYLDAAAAHEGGRPLARAWEVAFDQVDQSLLVLQHVLLGMNAHINLDLGIAAARSAPVGGVRDLEEDFERINDVLADMVDRMQDAVAAVSPWTAVVDRVGGRLDEAVTTKSVALARGRAWDFAVDLSATAGEDAHLIDERDRAVARLGAAIARPGRLTRSAIALARRREQADVGAVVAALHARGAPLPG